jgi:hypothetical protein
MFHLSLPVCRTQRHARSAIKLSLVLAFAALPALAATPDFGPNVVIFSPSMPSAVMQAQIDAIYATQRLNEFGPQRNAILFRPGTYNLDVPVGFYTQVIGLGASPNDVHIIGNVHADASARNDNATTTFWRAVENFSVTPTTGTMQWAVSQAVSFRRMHVLGDLVLHQNHGWASGGWMADSLTDGNVDSGTQQQWISRNSEWHSWTGSNWNMVFLGIPNPPAGQWPDPPFTKIALTPIIREKPFLQIDPSGNYSVFVPALRTNSSGTTWRTAPTPGTAVPITRFYIAHPADTAATLNAQLARGKNLLLTPGIYDLTAPLRITHPDTIVMGLGFATLRPINGTAALITADLDGITIASLLFDAGTKRSPVLLQAGPTGSKVSHAPSHVQDPISLDDVFFRVGGTGPASTRTNLEINSNDTIIDHTWIWRADHGAGAGWTSNPSLNGLVVNADNVTAYGLFVEHHQQYQVLWNGNHGRTYFYQSEIPYDPPTQAAYSSAKGTNGWASYKVAGNVTSHEAWGLGVYSVFRFPNVVLTRAIEVPTNPNVRFHDIVTIALDDKGGIEHVINNTGPSTSTAPRTTPRVTSFP